MATCVITLQIGLGSILNTEVGVDYSFNEKPAYWERDYANDSQRSGICVGASIFSNQISDSLGQVTLAKGSGEWNAPDKFVLRGDVRWLGSQYEDEENTLFLREAVVVGISVRRQFGDHLEFYLKADNIGDARTETSVGADGISYLGSPRIVLGGFRVHW